MACSEIKTSSLENKIDVTIVSPRESLDVEMMEVEESVVNIKDSVPSAVRNPFVNENAFTVVNEKQSVVIGKHPVVNATANEVVVDIDETDEKMVVETADVSNGVEFEDNFSRPLTPPAFLDEDNWYLFDDRYISHSKVSPNLSSDGRSSSHGLVSYLFVEH